MAVFLCTTAMSGSLGIYIVGKVQDDGDEQTQESKGKLIALNTAIPSFIAAIFFYISGIFYGRVKKEKEMVKEEALTKASQYKFEDTKESVQSYGVYEYN